MLHYCGSDSGHVGFLLRRADFGASLLPADPRNPLEVFFQGFQVPAVGSP